MVKASDSSSRVAVIQCSRTEHVSDILNCDIALPEGSSAEDYWEAVLKGAVNNKYSFNKSNLIEALKKQYEGGFIS